MHKRKKAYTVEEAHQRWLEEQQEQAAKPQEEPHRVGKFMFVPRDPQEEEYDDDDYVPEVWKYDYKEAPLSPYSARIKHLATTLYNTYDEDELLPRQEYVEENHREELLAIRYADKLRKEERKAREAQSTPISPSIQDITKEKYVPELPDHFTIKPDEMDGLTLHDDQSSDEDQPELEVNRIRDTFRDKL